jgi:hypothetical protein
MDGNLCFRAIFTLKNSRESPDAEASLQVRALGNPVAEGFIGQA